MTRSAGDIESSGLGTKGGLMIAVVCGFIRSSRPETARFLRSKKAMNEQLPVIGVISRRIQDLLKMSHSTGLRQRFIGLQVYQRIFREKYRHNITFSIRL